MKHCIDKWKYFGHLTKTVFVSSLFLALFFLAYSLVFSSKVGPNTFFGNLNISGKEIKSVDKIIENHLENYGDQEVIIIVGNEILNFNPIDLGIFFDSQRTTDKIQKPSNPIVNFTSLLKVRNIEPIYSIDFSKLSSVLDSNFKDVEKQSIDAQIVFGGGSVRISDSEQGVVVDRTKLARDLALKLDNLSKEPLHAHFVQEEPRIRSGQAQRALQKIQQLNEQNIILAYEFDEWTLAGDNLLNILEFYPQGLSSKNLFNLDLGSRIVSLKNVDFVGRVESDLAVNLNNEKIDEFIDEIAAIIDTPTIDATLEFDGVKVSQFTPAQDGRALDRIQVKKSILDSVSLDNLSNEIIVNITLPVAVTKAEIANEEINSLGIRELIASGVSYFTGSIPNRAFNIGLGSSFINGTLVPPGETFSFNKLVGPVSSEQGFKEAYVITRGRTVLDDGGGICQVSTTVFRAALKAGLPIVERTAHAYRVSYYEQRGFEPGYDATIWSPTVDLKFKNDTDHHILVQAIVDRSISKLQIDIYGTSDGRTVELSTPVLTNKRPAPEPLYQDDPTLSAGVVKQVDWAAQGLTSVFERKVFRGDEVLIDESIKSNFRPWQAVYLVGIGY